MQVWCCRRHTPGGRQLQEEELTAFTHSELSASRLLTSSSLPPPPPNPGSEWVCQVSTQNCATACFQIVQIEGYNRSAILGFGINLVSIQEFKGSDAVPSDTDLAYSVPNAQAGIWTAGPWRRAPGMTRRESGTNVVLANNPNPCFGLQAKR